MIRFSTQFLAFLSPKQKRWIWLIGLTITSVAIARLALHKEWLQIFIVLSFFAFKELFEYGRRQANSKAKWK